MSQQVGITMGTPIMSAIVTAVVHSRGGEENVASVLAGLSTAVLANAGLLRRHRGRGGDGTAAAPDRRRRRSPSEVCRLRAISRVKGWKNEL